MRKLLNIINSLLTSNFPLLNIKRYRGVLISKINSIKEKEKRK